MVGPENSLAPVDINKLGPQLSFHHLGVVVGAVIVERVSKRCTPKPMDHHRKFFVQMENAQFY